MCKSEFSRSGRSIRIIRGEKSPAQSAGCAVHLADQRRAVRRALRATERLSEGPAAEDGGRFVLGNEYAVAIAEAIIETFSRRHGRAMRPAPHRHPSLCLPGLIAASYCV